MCSLTRLFGERAANQGRHWERTVGRGFMASPEAETPGSERFKFQKAKGPPEAHQEEASWKENDIQITN